MRWVLVVISVAAIAVLGLRGFGEPGGASVAAKGGPPVKLKGKVNNQGSATVTGTSIAITAEDDLDFKPTFIQGAPGATVMVAIKNTGHLLHTFTVTSQHIDEEIKPGETDTVRVTIPANGAPAPFHCRFHKSSGMQGAFFSHVGSTSSSGSGAGSSGRSGGYGY